MSGKTITFLRYPGGKQRLLEYLLLHLPKPTQMHGRWVEPFVGGGSVFFAVNPQQALLADINGELIDLYRALRRCPVKVYRLLQKHPACKDSFYQIRNGGTAGMLLPDRAARTLYLNRTCFKGMWRYNGEGRFNVGYGGEDRRSALTKETLAAVSQRLRHARLRARDFEVTVRCCNPDDFLFLDPPYRPGAREITDREHYVNERFTYEDHRRLAKALHRATKRGVRWAMMTSSHRDIVCLYPTNRIVALPKGTGRLPGILTDDPGEVLICNYPEGTDEGVL